MNRKIVTILMLIVLSEGSTLYGLFLMLTFHYNVTYGASSSPPMISGIVMGQPYFLIPVSIGIIGWIATVYEVLTLKQVEFSGKLRRKMSREGFGRDVYRIFSGRGGARRLSIMYALDTPRIRNEIANITNTDWKEVDRNVKILESANLVRIKFSHGSMSVYNLTESGKELLDLIQSYKDNNSSAAGTAHS